jgi:hypothetical protein
VNVGMPEEKQILADEEDKILTKYNVNIVSLFPNPK